MRIEVNIKYILTLGAIILLMFTSCDKEVSTSPPEPEPPKGFIYVTSEPAGFQIYLDDRFTGRFTPDSLPFLEERPHTITLKRKYWKDTSLAVSVKENVLEQVEVNYLEDLSMYGRISFSSKPVGASIYLNDSLLQVQTPYISDLLLPGEYRFRYSYPNHRDNSAITIVESNKTSSASLSLRDTSVWVDYNTFTTSLPTDKLTAVTAESGNSVWVGTIDQGVVRIKGNSFKVFDQSNSQLPSNKVLCVLTDNQNRVWIGTEAGLALVEQSSVIIPFTTSNSDLPNNNVQSLDTDPENNIWVGTLGGLVKISNGVFSTYDFSNTNIPSQQIYSVKSINETEIWAVADTFLTKFDGQSNFEHFGRKDSNIPNSHSTGVDVTNSGAVWAVFSAQNIFYQNGTREQLIGGISTYNGLSWNSVLIGNLQTQFSSILVDSDDIIWVASNDGLLKFIDLQTSTAYRPMNSGILSLDVNDISEDSNGTLWIATNDGLSKFKKRLEFGKN